MRNKELIWDGLNCLGPARHWLYKATVPHTVAQLVFSVMYYHWVAQTEWPFTAARLVALLETRTATLTQILNYLLIGTVSFKRKYTLEKGLTTQNPHHLLLGEYYVQGSNLLPFRLSVKGKNCGWKASIKLSKTEKYSDFGWADTVFGMRSYLAIAPKHLITGFSCRHITWDTRNMVPLPPFTPAVLSCFTQLNGEQAISRSSEAAKWLG